MEANVDILEELVNNLKEEQMFDAVLFICNRMISIGKERRNDRMVAFSNLMIGELYIQEFNTKKSEELQLAKSHVLEAHEAFKHDSSLLS